jgi:hypothetical protein
LGDEALPRVVIVEVTYVGKAKAKTVVGKDQMHEKAQSHRSKLHAQKIAKNLSPNT